MKIAIPVLENLGENSPISEHFGHAPFFAFVDRLEDGSFTVNIVANPLEDHGPGDIPNYLAQQNVDLLVARGIGGRAIGFFDQLGIHVVRGASGTVKEILEQLNKNELQDRDYEVQEKFHRH